MIPQIFRSTDVLRAAKKIPRREVRGKMSILSFLQTTNVFGPGIGPDQWASRYNNTGLFIPSFHFERSFSDHFFANLLSGPGEDFPNEFDILFRRILVISRLDCFSLTSLKFMFFPLHLKDQWDILKKVVFQFSMTLFSNERRSHI